MFALERVGKLAGEHREGKTKQPFQSILDRDQAAMSKFTEQDWLQVIAATHASMGMEAFQALVKEWLDTAKDPRFGRPYTDLIYRPMLEVMRYLRAKGFRTYIVTGRGAGVRTRLQRACVWRSAGTGGGIEHRNHL
jgi:FMN phosphatase YigB (HAD superfamily)